LNDNELTKVSEMLQKDSEVEETPDPEEVEVTSVGELKS
jgi:hypothetical protein